MPNGLHFKSTGVPECMRAELPFSLGARHFYLFDQHRVIRICL